MFLPIEIKVHCILYNLFSNKKGKNGSCNYFNNNYYLLYYDVAIYIINRI